MQPLADTLASPLYRAFWRWHFYAGLLVMPVLMLMALTGALYLFKDEIEGVAYRSLLTVEARPAATTPTGWAAAATAAVPGRLAQLVPPESPGRSARLVVETAAGERRAVYVDPHDARVLGSTPEGGAMHTIMRLHSLDIAGPVFNLLVEVVAGWAIVMAATGIVLWWPRGRGGGVVTVRGEPGRRVFWRDLHAVVGVLTAGVIVFLAATGMPWSAMWGKEVRALTNAAGWGRPTPPASAAAWAPAHHAEGHDLPWALGGSQMHAAHTGHGLTLDAAVARLDAEALPRPYALTVPAEPGAAWSAAYLPRKVEATRTVYLDPGDGRVLADIGYDRFGPAAKAIEWGISVHQGRQFGLLNQLLMLGGCVAIWLLGLSALVMWWKRRPKGRLAAPPRVHDRRAGVALAAVVAPLAVLYPLVGASLVIVLGLDLIVQRLGTNGQNAGAAPM